VDDNDTLAVRPHMTALRALKYNARGFKMLPADVEELNKKVLKFYDEHGVSVTEYQKTSPVSPNSYLS
jgi:hypothetical protein